MRIIKCDKCGKKINYPMEWFKQPEFEEYQYQVDLCDKCYIEWVDHIKPYFIDQLKGKKKQAWKEVEQGIYRYFGMEEMIEED